MTLSTDQKGAIAESAIVHAAIKLGLGMFRPLSDGGRYDLILDVDGRLDRVQCKWAPMRGEAIVIRSYSARRSAQGLVRRVYGPGEIDALAAYSPDLDRCYYIPVRRLVGHPEVALRIAPSRNGQRRRVNWADD